MGFLLLNVPHRRLFRDLGRGIEEDFLQVCEFLGLGERKTSGGEGDGGTLPSPESLSECILWLALRATP
jgi:hypothetical protein